MPSNTNVSQAISFIFQDVLHFSACCKDVSGTSIKSIRDISWLHKRELRVKMNSLPLLTQGLFFYILAETGYNLTWTLKSVV